MTICLLNEKDNVLKPDHQYCICLFVGKEKYDTLEKIAHIFNDQLSELQENGIYDNDNIHWKIEFFFSADWKFIICLFVGKEKYDTLEKIAHIFNDQLSELQENGIYDNDNIHWKIEFFFSADWKFMYIIMGLNAPNLKYFCLYCDCELNNRWNMNLQWIITSGNFLCRRFSVPITFVNITFMLEVFEGYQSEGLRRLTFKKIYGCNKNTKGQKKPVLFPVIKQENYIPDELHLLLCISDVLMECFFNDLFKKKEFEQQIKNQIEQVIKDIKIYFEFFKSKSNGGKWNWTSLMGPDKKKILQNFPITQFISEKHEINNLKIKAKEWINLFCRPNQSQMNSLLQVHGLYKKEDSKWSNLAKIRLNQKEIFKNRKENETNIQELFKIQKKYLRIGQNSISKLGQNSDRNQKEIFKNRKENETNIQELVKIQKVNLVKILIEIRNKYSRIGQNPVSKLGQNSRNQKEIFKKSERKLG
ncbi:hypothetical protein Glove_141g121 [Diversispora epigaea]|uniref:Uncharacterized protein n=1 Tax=Diversispora epigaea TaxID=1348612 RepID=A0A397IXH4_9GLOM|nr:hypothetical protein Glove_141g121 [Diversispora epigaea]